MKKYHINPTTGRVSICHAIRSCPFGSLESDHYADQTEARSAYESLLSEETLPRPVVRDSLKEMDANDLAHGMLSMADREGLSSETLSTALEFASFLHAGQMRRNRGRHDTTPYIEHPLRVTYRLLKLGVRDQDVLNAALLHDTVEDCAQVYTTKFLGRDDVEEEEARELLLNHISTRYSPRTAEIVKSVTNEYQDPGTSKAMSPEEKNRIYKEHLEVEITGRPSAALVKMSDFIDNAAGLHHNDVPGFEAKVKKQATKYHPCISLFQKEISSPEFPLPQESRSRILAQLDRTEKRLSHIMEKYSSL